MMLALLNTLLALALVGLALLAFATGREHHVGDSVWLTVLPALGLAATLGVLTRQLAKRQGRELQTVLALGAIGLTAITDWWELPGVYGVFALLVVWWLGDFEGDAPTPAKRLEGTPTEVARFMWRRGDPSDAIRAELAARQMPADEVEKLLYEFTVEDDARQRMSPGR